MICVVLLIVFYYPFNVHGIHSVSPLSLPVLVSCVFFILITWAKIISNLLVFSKKTVFGFTYSCVSMFSTLLIPALLFTFFLLLVLELMCSYFSSLLDENLSY